MQTKYTNKNSRAVANSVIQGNSNIGKYSIEDNRNLAVMQKKIIRHIDSNQYHNTSKAYKTFLTNSRSTPLQLMGWDDLVYLNDKTTIGLRHVRTANHALTGEQQIVNGVEGDAVPLKPEIALYNSPPSSSPMDELRSSMTAKQKWESMKKNEDDTSGREQLIKDFSGKIIEFIKKELNSVSIDLDSSNWSDLSKDEKLQRYKNAMPGYIDRLSNESFLLPSNMGGYQLPPTDYKNRDYAGLGKFGKQSIKSSQFRQKEPIKLSKYPDLVENLKLQVRIDLITVEEEREVENAIDNIFLPKVAQEIFNLIEAQISSWRAKDEEEEYIRSMMQDRYEMGQGSKTGEYSTDE